MKLKYYLRGLGIGVLVTAFIMGIAGKEKPMTDAEIKIRAAQLGMVEETVLSDLKTKESAENKDLQTEASPEGGSEAETAESITTEESSTSEKGSSTADNGAEKQDTDNEKNSAENEEAENSNPANQPNKTVVQSNGVVSTEAEYVVITIDAGSSCTAVSQKLYEAGVVESADEYNTYLTSNGYAHSLQSGQHRIPVGASEEEIAKIICRK